MNAVQASIDIKASPLQVWKIVMDPHRLGDWVTIHRRLNHADRGDPRVGYEMDQRIQLRGVPIDVHWRLIECDPGVRAVWEGRGPARSHARTEYLLDQRTGESTRFDYHNEFRPPLGPIGALAGRALVGGIPDREAKQTLLRLRDLLEREGRG